jgi:hypothetical protein
MNSSVNVPSFSREMIKFVEQLRLRCVACGENGHRPDMTASFQRFRCLLVLELGRYRAAEEDFQLIMVEKGHSAPRLSLQGICSS